MGLFEGGGSNGSPATAAFAGTAISAGVNLAPVASTDWGRLFVAMGIAVISGACYKLAELAVARIVERLRRKRD
jgi:hypothetical protein